MSRTPFARKVSGYPKLAAQIGIRPELAIFRRFGSLNMENLLYLQAELVLLEEALERQQQQDSASLNLRTSKYSLNWYQLRNSALNGDVTQLDIVLEIRKVLEQYNNAMIQQAQILAYPKANARDLKFIQNFLHNDGLCLCGPDAPTWGSVLRRKDYQPDLVNISPQPEEAPFSNWAIYNMITYLLRCGCARFVKPSALHGVVAYEEADLTRVNRWLTSIIASLVLIAPICILYKVQNMPTRLGLIACFSLIMTICLNLFTTAKPSEIFAITSAFAAVQVVFVSADK